jgi:hypothetical protein
MGRLSNGASPCPTNQMRPSRIGKNSFHVVALDQRGAIVLRQKWSRSQIEARLATMSLCLIGMEACVRAHHLSRKLQVHGHDARLRPTKYVRLFITKGRKTISAMQRRLPRPCNAREGKRSARLAKLSLRFGKVELACPGYTRDRNLPKSVSLILVEVVERNPPAREEAVRWRLLTTHDSLRPTGTECAGISSNSGVC